MLDQRAWEAGTSHRAPSGGTRSDAETGRPFHGVSSAMIVPTLTTPEPPNYSASVFRISTHSPPNGRPTR